MTGKGKGIALGAAALALGLVLGGCTGGGSSSHKHFTIGVSEASTAIPFLRVMDAALTAEAKKLHMTTEILDGQLKAKVQSANIDKLVSEKVDLIIVVASDKDALVPAINRAAKAGIPVIALNGAVSQKAKVITYVGASDFDYGAGEGQLLVKALPTGGSVAVILGPKKDAATSQRFAGLVSVLSQHPGYHIVTQREDDFGVDQDLAAVKRLLIDYPTGHLDAIVAEGPQVYVGANFALKNARYDVAFIAGDYPTEVRSSIQKRAIFGTVNQSPALEGKLGAKYAWEWLTGDHGSVPTPQALVDLPLVTRANVKSQPAVWSMN